MKNFTPFIAFLCILLLGEKIAAQVTKISNNTDFTAAIPLGNKALLITREDSLLWVTNGTATGTSQLVNTVFASGQFVIYKNKIYFAGKSAAKGTELWVTDCTPSGTKIVKDINTGTKNSSPYNFFVYDNTLFFFATTTANGTELWKTNGTAGGTTMVKDIYPGNGSSNNPNSPTFFYAANDVLFFQANDSQHGNELWKTNGSAAGTVMVKDLNLAGNLQITTYNTLNDKFVFAGKDSDPNGIKLWQSNGTSGGTTLIKNIYPDSSNASFNAQSLSKFKNLLVFSLQGIIINFPQFSIVNRLWSTDGTGTGTKLIKDLGGNNMGISFGTLTPTIKTKFYFTTFTEDGSLLWESNATTNGTKITKTIGNSLDISSGHIPIIITDFLTSDPDEVGTTTFKGKFFMAADDGVHGYEPWITNGTANGTKLVKDIYKNSGSSLSFGSSETNSFIFIYSKQGLYFAADDNKTGNELWFSDGTAGGTAAVANINPGNKDADPFLLCILSNHLYIGANDGDNTQGHTDLYKVNAIFDTLTFAASEEAVAATIAPDGSTFSVYPNPAKDRLNVSLNKNLSSKHISLIITDQRGKQVYANEINGMQASSAYSIDISRFAQGTYYLEVRTDKGIVSTKFIKVK